MTASNLRNQMKEESLIFCIFISTFFIAYCLLCLGSNISGRWSDWAYKWCNFRNRCNFQPLSRYLKSYSERDILLGLSSRVPYKSINTIERYCILRLIHFCTSNTLRQCQSTPEGYSLTTSRKQNNRKNSESHSLPGNDAKTNQGQSLSSSRIFGPLPVSNNHPTARGFGTSHLQDTYL